MPTDERREDLERESTEEHRRAPGALAPFMVAFGIAIIAFATVLEYCGYI